MQLHHRIQSQRLKGLIAMPNLARAIAMVVGSLALTAGATAQVSVINTVNDPIGDSGFTLTFPALGLTTSSSVVNTQIEFEIDEQTQTARFVKYSQLVEPLLLPDSNGGMISTGDIRIKILSSNGTFNPSAQTFTTNDVFEISFTGDLSSFGLQSPLPLPAISTGTVTGGTNNTQRIDMVWQGTGQIGDPSQPLDFSYVSKNFTIVQSPIDQLLAPVQACGNSLFGLLGAGMMSLMFVGMKCYVRRRMC